MERLQKVMAEAGIASRRTCEQMIRDGQVKVNGKTVIQLPVLVDPQVDRIVVSGRKLRFESKVYYLLNKPKNVVCTNYDPQGRRRAIDLLKDVRQRVYPVGRLDADSKGLLILTNDGELANQLTHPSFGILKTYVADIAGSLHDDEIKSLKEGMYFNMGRVSADHVKLLRRGPKQSLVEISLREGRNRQVRRMLARLGHPVRQLTRVRIGGLTLRGLGVGHFRPLIPQEIASLHRSVQAAQKRTKTGETKPTKAKPHVRKKTTPTRSGPYSRPAGKTVAKRPAGKSTGNRSLKKPAEKSSFASDLRQNKTAGKSVRKKVRRRK